MADDVPRWVRRWGQVKAAFDLAAVGLFGLLCALLAVSMPAIFADLVYHLFFSAEWKARFPRFYVIGATYLVTLAALGLAALDHRAQQHRRRAQQNGGGR